ncbi:transcriptional regulator ATRX-like isoform X2 [Ostrea edulis]|uniref:transcriptional regulator ATRX-like isoform X2 n=1 Tax=Ostrea edulis TaxID=37623 RepID=UPI0024AF341B|nr:transcriptional regulator ATRX-like isoform X2 [Ostrea edulis]XP_056009781.1 transcriptional regulator ATRX-like isoform X2 [Ostrea edulis]
MSKATQWMDLMRICKTHLKKQPSLIKLIKKRYRESSVKYLESSEFYDSLHITRARIESKPKEIFLYLRDFLEDLKSNKAEENELKRKRDDSSSCATDDHLPSKKFKEDEKSEGKDLFIQNISKSSNCALESKQVLETSEACAKSATCLATNVDYTLPKDEKVHKEAHPFEGTCESDSEIQIESLESSSEEEGCKGEKMSNKKIGESLESSSCEEGSKGEKMSNRKIEESLKSLSEEEGSKGEKMSNKMIEDFEVLLNEDYSNGSTGSVLESFKISRAEEDSNELCDSTVRDESSIVLDNEEKSKEQDTRQSLMTEKLEVDDDESPHTHDAKLSVSSSEKFLECESRKNVVERTKVSLSESVADKSPDSTTTEPQEKTLRKVPITPSKYKDVFLKLKTTVDMVKENLPMSPMQNVASSPDSSSKMDVDMGSVELAHTEENPDPVQVIEDGDENDDIDTKNESKEQVDTKNKTEEQTDMTHKALVHTESYLDLSPKMINKEQHKNDMPGVEDSSQSGEGRNEDMDEDVCRSPDVDHLRVEGFQNARESPLKIVRVTSEAALDELDSAKEQSCEIETALENGDNEEKKTEQKASTVTSQMELDMGASKEESQKEKTTEEEPSDCAGMAKNKKKGSKKQIERLEKLLKDIRDKIEELKNAEVDLDDEDSAYIMEEKYQKKFVKVWKKLCEIKESSTDTGRPSEKKFKYEGTRYPDINRKIEKFVNKQKCFPDYHDIRQIITNVNSRKTLNIKGTAIDRLAREAFADVGDQLQKRRERDFKYTFLGHLPSETKIVRNEDDPAYDNKSLQIRLEENKKISRSRMNEVIEKFVMKQDKRGEDEEEEEEEEDDTQEDDIEDVDVPEMDQIINDESQDDNLDSTEISQEVEDSNSHLSRSSSESNDEKLEASTENAERNIEMTTKGSESNDEKLETSTENAERNVEMTTKEVSEPETEDDIMMGEKNRRKDTPVPHKPLEEEDVVYIDDDDDDNDDIDCNSKAVKEDTRNSNKQPVRFTEEKPEEIPEFIKTLHSEIMSQCNSIAASMHPTRKNLSTAKKLPGKNFGTVVVDFTGKGKNLPGYQAKSFVKGSNPGYPGESRTPTRGKRNESGDDVEIVSSNILRSTSVKQTRPWNEHLKPDVLENKHKKDIKFIPLKNINAKPQTLFRSTPRSPTSCDTLSTCTTSFKRGNNSTCTVGSLSHPGDSVERKYVPARTALRVVKTAEEDDDDDIIVLD